MPSNGNAVKFAYLSYEKYATLDKDEDQIYFTSDTDQLFVGSKEYSRPVMYGDALPDTLLPPNSLFYNSSDYCLYLSKDGEEWTPVSNFYIHPDANTETEKDEETLDFGASFDAETVEVDETGHVVKISKKTYTLPKISISEATGDGNAVTDVTEDDDGNVIITKGETFVTESEFEEAISNLTSFKVDAGPDGTGYESLDALKEAHPEGEAGVIYLVKSDTTETSNQFSEYLWIETTESYEMFGTFGNVDLSDYVKKSTTINGHALDSDIELTKDDIGLENVDNTADADKEVKSAGSLTTPIDVELTGDATGKVESWDGSENLTIETTVNHATYADDADHASSADSADEADHATSADTATTADSATKATQDAEGNVINETYATKEEVNEAIEDVKVVWEIFYD